MVIPHSLQERVVKISHEGHQGILLTKQFLQSCVWFPGTDKLVEREVKSCLPCQAATPVTTRTPLVMSELSSKPWERVAIDFCGPFPAGELALVVVDEYSRYPELQIVTSTSMSAIRPKLEKIFAIHGIPDLVKSDNSPPFDSHASDVYAKEKGFIHKPVTPLWPEANGIVEHFMQLLVKSARASAAAGRNWKNEIYTFVANYRATPRSSMNAMPHQLLMNRSVKVKLPQVSVLTYDLEVMGRDTTEKQKMKVYADSRRNAKPHHFRVGDPALVKQKKSNKLSNPFEPKLYVITKVKGSMIITKWLSDSKNITRNSSQFKLLNLPMHNIQPVSREETEIDDDQELFQEVGHQPQNQQLPMSLSMPPAVLQSPTKPQSPELLCQPQLSPVSPLQPQQQQSEPVIQAPSSPPTGEQQQQTVSVLGPSPTQQHVSEPIVLRRSLRKRKEPEHLKDYVKR